MVAVPSSQGWAGMKSMGRNACCICVDVEVTVEDRDPEHPPNLCRRHDPTVSPREPEPGGRKHSH